MELTWIEDFLALAATRNFTQAASQCATTQPAFSRRLRRLEDWLGCLLIDRDSRPIQLTQEGESFLPRAKRLREDMLDARRIVRSLSSHYQKPVRIYTTNTIAIGFFPSLVKKADLQNFSLVVASISSCLEAVKSGHATTALVPQFPSDIFPSPFLTTIVGTDRISLMARPEVASQIIIEDGKLKGPILMYAPKTSYGSQISSLLEEHKLILTAPPLCESPSAEALAAQARSGMGAAWIPESIAPAELIVCKAAAALTCSYNFVLVSAPPETSGETALNSHENGA